MCAWIEGDEADYTFWIIGARYIDESKQPDINSYSPWNEAG